MRIDSPRFAAGVHRQAGAILADWAAARGVSFAGLPERPCSPRCGPAGRVGRRKARKSRAGRVAKSLRSPPGDRRETTESHRAEASEVRSIPGIWMSTAESRARTRLLPLVSVPAEYAGVLSFRERLLPP